MKAMVLQWTFGWYWNEFRETRMQRDDKMNAEGHMTREI